MFPGVFTVPVTGVWRVSFSLRSYVQNRQKNFVYIYHNQQQIEETIHSAYSETSVVYSTGGRELVTKAARGDTFHLGTTRMGGAFHQIIACFEFLSI